MVAERVKSWAVALIKPLVSASAWRSLRRIGGEGSQNVDAPQRVYDSQNDRAEPAERRSAVSLLSPWSEAFLRCGFGSAESKVNIVLFDEVYPAAVFAGVKTALEVAVRLASQPAPRSLRLVTVNEGNGPADSAPVTAEWLGERFLGSSWEVVRRSDIDDTEFGTGDLWVATYWATAHALDVAARSGRVDANDVVYLIQDYEPGFFPWSTQSALAESTYAAGFIPLINSAPVAEMLESRGFGSVPTDLVFSPAFDVDELRAVAARRRLHPQPTVYFYGRPSKPRNMFDLGVAVLRQLAETLDERGIDAAFVMAGEDGPDIDLGPFVMTNRGRLSRSEYFELLSGVDVGLCLQASPHPGHAAFDVAISGATAVTNELDGARAGAHPGISAVPARLDALTDALLAAVLAFDPHSVGSFAAPGERLGRPLDEAIATAWERHLTTAPPSR